MTCVVTIFLLKCNDIKLFFSLFILVLSFLKIEENSQSSSSDRVDLDKSENERDVSVEPSPNRSGFCNEIKDEKLDEHKFQTDAFKRQMM